MVKSINRPINQSIKQFSSDIFLLFPYNGFSFLSVIDIDECSASIPVCDANANCRNNPGSYVCFCKAGFTGNGKRCAGESVLKDKINE